MKTIVIAGASGYLGRHVVHQAKKRGYIVRVLLRRNKPEDFFEIQPDEVVTAEATDATTLAGLCDGADIVFSSLGITRQKDGLRYQDVDYQANKNILDEALRAGVKDFAYVSVIHGRHMRNSRLVDAKEKFVDTLRMSKLHSLIIRPTGFFSDMRDFLDMAKKGNVYLFGDGSQRINPIHGVDLADALLDALERGDSELEVGGPDTYSFRELGQLAIDISGSTGKVLMLPDVLRRLTLRLLPMFTPEKTYGPVQFFLSAMAHDAAASEYGSHRLKDFFTQQVLADTNRT